MSGSLDQFAREIMGGQRRGIGAAVLRGMLCIAEPLYSGVMSARNRLFDSGLRRQHRLPRPVVSVGNITTGGTGKTPVVIRLVQQLCEQYRLRPAVLLRGYTTGKTSMSDERALLERVLDVPVIAGADRVASAHRALAADGRIDLFILDDGFQHRRVARQFDLVLVDATCPFGFGHVLPRGLLREPLRGLVRARAFLITHADEVAPTELARVQRELREHNTSAAVYAASHAHERFEDLHSGETMAREALRGRRYYAFCGIGNPGSFQRILAAAGGEEAGHRWFADHHDYSAADLAALHGAAAAAGAELLITTTKDAVKLRALAQPPGALPIWQAILDIRFDGDGEARLLAEIISAVRSDQRCS